MARPRRRAIFVERPVSSIKIQLLRIEAELPFKPGSPALQDIRSILLQCMCGLLNVHPRPRSQAPSALRLTPTCRSTHRRSTISSSVTSLQSSIISTTNASCASKLEDLRQPCGRDVGSSLLALAIHRIAVEIATPNRRRPAVQTYPPQTFSIRVIEDRRSVLEPTSTSSLWMLISFAAPRHLTIDSSIAGSALVSTEYASRCMTSSCRSS